MGGSNKFRQGGGGPEVLSFVKSSVDFKEGCTNLP